MIDRSIESESRGNSPYCRINKLPDCSQRAGLCLIQTGEKNDRLTSIDCFSGTAHVGTGILFCSLFHQRQSSTLQSRERTTISLVGQLDIIYLSALPRHLSQTDCSLKAISCVFCQSYLPLCGTSLIFLSWCVRDGGHKKTIKSRRIYNDKEVDPSCSYYTV